MKVPPKRPQCAHCGFLKVDICASPFPLPLLIHLNATGIHSLARRGVNPAAETPTMAKISEHHVGDWKLEWMSQVLVY